MLVKARSALRTLLKPMPEQPGGIDAAPKPHASRYDLVWSQRLDSILGVIDAGPQSLAQVLATVRRNEDRRRKSDFRPKEWSVLNQQLALPGRPAGAMFRSAVVEAVLDRCQNDTTKIIETGSGWGEHLCNIFLEGGPANATYWALEIEESGRKCAERLAALDPRMTLRSAPFDYRRPDYSAIAQDDGHTILLTVQSIEQVDTIPGDVFTRLLDRSRSLTGIHFEPIGWQMQPQAKWNALTKAHHKRCSAAAYNANLWAILKDLEASNTIRIEVAEPNFIGLAYNPDSFIVWHKR